MRPWRSLGLIVALVASFAVPAFMAASADQFLVSAADSITRQVLDEQPGSLDVSVIATGRLSSAGVDALDASMREELGRITRLGPADHIISAELGLQEPAVDGQPPVAIIGSGARFIARNGAIDALDVIQGDRDVEGIWISERLSSLLDLPAGTLVSVEGSDPFPIAGVFANLWEGERNPYWDDVPAAFVPRFSRVFAGPSFETMIVPESLLLSWDVIGSLRWDTVVSTAPASLAGLAEHANQVRGIDRSYTGSASMREALDQFVGPSGATPNLNSEVFDVRRDIDDIVAELDQPITTASIGGIALGLLVTAAGAAFAVRKREAEVRLLRADGDAAWRFAARAIAQFAIPAGFGAALGVAATWLIAVGPGGVQNGVSIDGWSIARVALIGLVVAAIVTGWTSSRVMQVRRARSGPIRLTWLLPVVGVACAAWVQVGTTGETSEVDALVIAFPLVGLIAGVGLIVSGARWLMHRVHRSGRSLPPALFLAWRRITSADASALLLSTALGVALGLVIFSSSLVAGLDISSEAKATAAVGANTQLRVDGPIDVTLPDRTTLVQVLSTRSTIGRAPITVLAIDPATYAGAVSWHPTFGSTPDEVIRALERPVDADVAAVVAGRFDVPGEAGFGTALVTSYEVVGSVPAVPLTSRVAPTLVVDAGQVVAAALRAHDLARPIDVAPDEWAAEFRSPFLSSTELLISQLDAEALTAFTDDNDINVREVITLAERRDEVGNRAARWTFDYISLLAIVAGLAAVGTLFFFLSEQRAARQLSSVMAERMGLRRRSAAVAAVVEVLGLVAVAFVAGAVVAVAVSARVFGRFEPDPLLAPEVGLDIPWGVIGTVAGGATLVVIVVALANQWFAGKRSYAEVLRDS